MKTVLLTFGTRPEAIKMCPVVQALKRRPEIRTAVCVTGQHRHLLDQVLQAFQIVPDYDLSVMQDKQTLFDITTRVLERIKPVLEEVKPSVVLVHGDTTSTFSVALACFYKQIPVGHVEAGLRTWDMLSPYPEEFNREAVGLLASLHFAPTETSRQNLLREGKRADAVFVTGNTVIDALQTTVQQDYSHPVLAWAKDSRMILLTAHRRESIGEPMHRMFRAVRRIVDAYSDVKVVFPIHPNPAVREAADAEFSGCDRIRMLEPLDVLDFHNIMARCYLALTDSGGVQEEAPSLGKPVLVMRDTTERPEGIAAGTLKLVGTREETIYDGISELMDDRTVYDAMAHAVNPYGDGKASERIADVLCGDENGICPHSGNKR